MEEQLFFDTEKFIEDLNEQQRKAVNFLDGPLLIMAGAGSGKTRVLTYRIANLIANGVSPWNILAITFTNKAAGEMKSRVEKLIGAASRDVWLSTFHSFCAKILRFEIEVDGKFDKNFAIYTPRETKTLIDKICDELNLDKKIATKAQHKISDLKNELISCKDFEAESLNVNEYLMQIAQIYKCYQKKLLENNALDFDDLIFATVNLFRHHADILERYQERFKYISVDEYQDTNFAQYTLTKILASKYKNLCVVGDADQSIYGWRGADMRNILNFEHDYPRAEVIKLEQNYRSTKIILEAANAVIKKNDNRKPKNLWTQNNGGDKIFFKCFDRDLFEAEGVAREIRRLVDHENFRYSEIALLYRTNAQSRSFEEKFFQLEIPYIIIAGLKFYDRKEIRDIVAYLNVISNPRDDVHLTRIINTPHRGLGATNFNRLSNFAAQNNLSILELITQAELLEQVPALSSKFVVGIKNFAAMMISFIESSKNLSIDELIEVVLQETGYYQMLDELDDLNESISRKENLSAFVNSATEFLEQNNEATLQEFLNHIALITDIDEMDDQDSRVKLMTIHAAKGLEFPVVFLVGMEEKLFPHSMSLNRQDDIEEERRAYYVAMTRAQTKLYLTAAQKRRTFGDSSNQEISRFVGEIPRELLQGDVHMIKPPKKIDQQQIASHNPTINLRPTHYQRSPMSLHSVQSKPIPPKKSSSVIIWKAGDQLNHKVWGLGTVMVNDGQNITVLFSNPQIGLKKIKASVAPINKI